jgi:hypothetical protein
MVRKNLVTEKLKGTRFALSNKSIKIKKDLPNKAQISIQEEQRLKKKLKGFNEKLCLILLEKCNIKSFKKNYKSNTVKRI